MKCRALAKLAILALALTPVAMLHAADETRLVTLASDPWPPYVIGQMGQDAKEGVGVELMQTIFDRLDDVRLQIPLMPWNRALREVEVGTKDGIGILLKTPDREAYLDYTDVVFRSYNMVWYAADGHPNGFEWQHHADLTPFVVGVIRGHSYGEKLDRMIADGQISTIEVSSARQLFAMLDKGRIDLAFADRLVGGSFVASYANSGKQISATSKPAAVEVYYIAFSKRSAARHLIPELNRVVSELREQGVIQGLVEGIEIAGETVPAE